jgi:hypothetical protein
MSLDAPFRIAFDNARDPYAARNALGITSDVAVSYQPLDGDLTALAALAGTNTIYYRSASDTWTAVTIGANLTFSAGTLNTAVTPAAASDFPATAWTAWTPTITSSVGTITSTTINMARYTKAGKTITAYFDITVTNAGTGAGFLQISIPITASASGGGHAFGQEVAITNKAVTGGITSGHTNITLYDGASTIATNVRIAGIMIYEGT